MFLYTTLVLIILLSVIFYVYNKLRRNSKNVEISKLKIDFQLDKRFKIFEVIISNFKNSIDYEKTVLKEIVQLRSHAQSSKAIGDIKSQFEAEEKISKLVNIIFESYRDIKELKNFLELQEEIISIEKNLMTSKQEYNLSIQSYNIIKSSFLGAIVVNIFKSKLYFIYDYWQLPKNNKLEQFTLES